MRSQLVAALLLGTILVVVGTRTADARPRPARAKSTRFQANKGFGVGFMFGVPTGISAKYYLGPDKAIDFALGNYYRHDNGYRYDNGAINFHADFLWHPLTLVAERSLWIPFYAGVGARVLSHRYNSNQNIDIGVRAPAGVALDFNNVPIDVFLELALVIDLLHRGPHSRADYNLAVGARYFFN